MYEQVNIVKEIDFCVAAQRCNVSGIYKGIVDTTSLAQTDVGKVGYHEQEVVSSGGLADCENVTFIWSIQFVFHSEGNVNANATGRV